MQAVGLTLHSRFAGFGQPNGASVNAECGCARAERKKVSLMDVLIGATKSKLQWKCPKCKWNTLVDPLTFYMASLHVATIDCHHCETKFHVDITLLDPRSPTLRAAVQLPLL